MANEQEKLQQLLLRVEQLQKKQNESSKELFQLRKEIFELKSTKSEERPVAESSEVAKPKEVPKSVRVELNQPKDELLIVENQSIESKPVTRRASRSSSDLEKFIGENLISKIGIIITIIGVAIGAKYTIEHNLISPLTRIVLGYVAGVLLLLVGMRLKKKYEKYSAVLVSGAMTIMYFITFAAHSFYGLIPQTFSFGLMVLFTIFTVVAALNYKQQIIAQLGLVGAYAVPFLLSDGSGKAAVLFTYVAIINMGILFVSFKKYWRSLYYSSFILSWLIFFSWFIFQYRTNEHFTIAFIFIGITFVTFYATYLAYKILQKKVFEIKDVILILANAFIYFAVGYGLLAEHSVGKELLGLFALANALIHFIVTVVVYKQKLADKNLFYLVGGLVLVFLTIAIPIQLDGSWVTLLWAGEAALLFWIGRSKNVKIYENLSYPVMALAFFSLMEDWSSVYGNIYQLNETGFTPLFNINFLSSVLFLLAFGFITYWLYRKEANLNEEKNSFLELVKVVIPSVLVLVTFASIGLELIDFWDLKIFRANKIMANTHDIMSFKHIWLVNYTLSFLIGLALLNRLKIKNDRLGMVSAGLSILGVFLFLIVGLYEYSELRESYIADHTVGMFHLGIRYLSFVFAGVLIWITRQSVYKYSESKEVKLAMELFLHFVLVWVLSSELLQWLDLSSTDKNYKLGLSILWGLYSLFLIVLGIWKNKKHLRIGAMVLFGVTLIKLFIYDLSYLNTISKTIVFVSLGVLLLIISFLYNKYSSTINYEKED